MRPGAKVMFTIAIFLTIMSVIYIFATMWVQDDGYLVGLEWVGAVSMILATVLALMLGGYMQFIGSRIDLLPEDYEEAEVEDAAGTYGFFSPSSIWPFAMSAAVAVLGFGVIFMYYWMIALGAILLVWTCTMLNLQYGLPKEKH
ncbi:cytochrome-c oxidase [Corynebacterium yudongzhengii]|uniref:Cytochrome c oxidase polypeptide 4 n=1 Tax=Corynebacterium yudongzhengii TaxID=2080740 RepID=A0A2U1T7B8_9CORY|nr:cytochrome c oxidase subunit 4 [Corynebacterium yudongzhengii]AWB81542.1 cytochrome-c oxidase [Corynebacterium yudongzhengii]PWC01887.1 cytochrome-c oxidase [Corynebacterium yudongzhengii]